MFEGLIFYMKQMYVSTQCGNCLSCTGTYTISDDDHGALSGLADDCHPQYLIDNRIFCSFTIDKDSLGPMTMMEVAELLGKGHTIYFKEAGNAYTNLRDLRKDYLIMRLAGL